jgi:preprotein translocase SecE subunit
MALGIYKKGQGYYTRLCTTIAYALLVAMGAWWVSEQFVGIDFGFPSIYASATAAVLVIAIFGLLGFWLIGRRTKSVDFLIATEGEMKKVNWSTRREVVGSTIIVLFISFVIAVLCASFDLVFAWFFTVIDVLDNTV